MSNPSQAVSPPDSVHGATSSPVRDILALTERPGRGVVRRRPARARAVRPAPGCARRSRRCSPTTAAAARCSTRRPRATRALRAAIAQRLTARGLDTEADDLLITSGSQQALTLIATVLLEPGDRVLVEEPSYLAALQCFALAGAVAVPVACDDDGLDPEALDELVARAPAEAALHGARRSTTRPAARCRWSAAARWPRSPSGRGCGWSRTTPTASCATAASRCPRSRRCPAPGPHAGGLDAVEDRRPGAAGRLGAGAADAAALADDRQAGGRPALLDDRPGGRGAVAGDAPT